MIPFDLPICSDFTVYSLPQEHNKLTSFLLLMFSTCPSVSLPAPGFFPDDSGHRQLEDILGGRCGGTVRRVSRGTEALLGPSSTAAQPLEAGPVCERQRVSVEYKKHSFFPYLFNQSSFAGWTRHVTVCRLIIHDSMLLLIERRIDCQMRKKISSFFFFFSYLFGPGTECVQETLIGPVEPTRGFSLF